MLDRERQETILRLVKQNTFASIHDIVELVNVSEATVRRDLDRLEASGYIRRVRGGAEATEELKSREPVSHELPFEYRKGIMHEKKRLIAKQAASMCTDGETIIIDGGSTTYQMVEFLTPLKLKIITNSLISCSLTCFCPSHRCPFVRGVALLNLHCPSFSHTP